jgi:hypothetical protein
MRLTRFAAIALSASALVAVSAPFAAHAATEHPAAHDTLAAAAPSVAVYSCTNQPQVRPSTYDQFCDGSGYFTGLHWSTWNASIAAATGVQYLNNCTPNCAAGKFSHRTVDLIFWRSLPVKGHPGERGYSQMTVLYPGARLPGSPGGSGNTYTQAPPGAFPGEF